MVEPIDTDIAIETPEHIVFRHRVAGPMRRLFAYAIDTVICYGSLFALALVVGLIISALGAGSMEDALDGMRALSGLVLLLLFAVQWLYFTFWEERTGATPGKRLLHLCVLRTDGTPVDASASALRNIMRAVDALPLPMLLGLFSPTGLLSMVLTRRFQRLGDLVAGTIVVVRARAVGSAPIVLWPPATEEEAAGLSKTVSLDADERHAIELFLRRIGTLGKARERELASMIAAPLAARFGLPNAPPERLIALVYDRATQPSGDDAPPSLRAPWRT